MNPTGASTPAASGTEMMGLVILGGVEGELAGYFAGCDVGDVDVQALDGHQDGVSSDADADADAVQVSGDGLWAGIYATSGQLGTQPENEAHCARRGGLGAVSGSARVGLERGLTLGFVAGNEFAHPPFRDSVTAGNLSLGATLKNDSGDDKASNRHASL